MGFYEDDRIRAKQRKYLLQKAEEKITLAKQTGMSDARILNLFKSKVSDTTLNETEREIYKVAVGILEAL
jgi:hypothetical protein